ncbi:Hypothetical protein I595_3031 [Croceitalea dokdonensis DOKDO 023]|uniref:Uncharacterized protein n=1 Tax=Croceitalea dokdonensis DOKDO 023 TaxID=1300341 RepID=A0A0N8H3N3_9FLAO|nr:hypothetical protein [Croceitalea dokdonensis]KPM31052.1 Hypothetical protein I595_3031 [Croceitalea dokdonensis DOKDO 023]
MSKTITPDGNKLTGLFCNFFGHHFVVSKRVTEHINEYRCIHCQKQVSTDERGKLSTLTPQIQEINNTLEDMYQKRNRRSVRKTVPKSVA